MIEAKNLTKYYGTHPAVQDITFSIGEGETVGFLGPNGAGKSTTMRMLTGFLTPTSGTARIGGYDTRTESLQARQQMGYLPENTPLYREMRVREFLNYRARLKGVPAATRRAAIDETLEKCRIADVATRIIGQLSKGYRQRVGLADCLLGKPKLLILDEPTVGLDPNQVVETRSLIRELGEERTVFLSTHILHEVELVCQRVLIVHEGRLIAEGNPNEMCRTYSGCRTLTVQLFADGDVPGALQALPGVEAVTALPSEGNDNAATFSIECKTDADPRIAISQLAAEKSWLLQEMRLEPVRLEDIFATLTDATVGA